MLLPWRLVALQPLQFGQDRTVSFKVVRRSAGPFDPVRFVERVRRKFRAQEFPVEAVEDERHYHGQIAVLLGPVLSR